jgi:hypothetical protein
VPGVDLDPRADPAPVSRSERLAGVADREPVDVAQVVVLLQRDDAAEEAYVVVPARLR